MVLRGTKGKVALMLAAGSLAVLAITLTACGGDKSTEAPKMMQYDAPPPMTIDPNKKYTATIQMEKGGKIVIELFPKEAPVTVNSFVFLAREGFYDRVTFHREYLPLWPRRETPQEREGVGRATILTTSPAPSGATTAQGWFPWLAEA